MVDFSWQTKYNVNISMIVTTFDLTDSSGTQLYTRLHISPYQYGFNYSGSVVSADSIVLYESGSVATVSLVPNSYQVRLHGRNAETIFDITLPTGSDHTTQSAANFITSSPQGQYPFTASNALTAVTSSYAVTASYAYNGGGAGSMQVFSANYSGSAPTFTPSTPPAIAIDNTNGYVYWYYNGVWH